MISNLLRVIKELGKYKYSESGSSCHEDSPPARNPPCIWRQSRLIQWSVSCVREELVRVNDNFLKRCKTCIKENGLKGEQGEYQIMMCNIYLSFNQLTSVNTRLPARLAWRQMRSFRPAGPEETFRDKMSQIHSIIESGYRSTTRYSSTYPPLVSQVSRKCVSVSWLPNTSTPAVISSAVLMKYHTYSQVNRSMLVEPCAAVHYKNH